MFFLTRFSMAEWLRLSVEVIHQFVGVTSSLGGFLSAWMQLTPIPLHLIMALLFLLSLLGLIGLWLAVLSRTFRKGTGAYEH